MSRISNKSIVEALLNEYPDASDRETLSWWHVQTVYEELREVDRMPLGQVLSESRYEKIMGMIGVEV